MRYIITLALLTLTTLTTLADQVVKVGIIGLDTSHAPAFAKMLNAEKPEPQFAGCRIVAAYPQGSRTIPSSVDRVPEYTDAVKKLGVEIVDSIDALLKLCDVVLLESNDGQVHLEQALPVLKAGKRLFIDKPIAASLPHTIALFKASEKYNTPIFSCSSLRYTKKMIEATSGTHGKVIGADSYSPCSLEPSHPDFYWYGIHGVEPLFTLLGPECKSVTRTSSPGTDFITGLWHDGRIGSVRGTRAGAHSYGTTAFLEKRVFPINDFAGYGMMLAEIVKFFKGGPAPIDPKETIAIFAFMSAADESKKLGGIPVEIEDVLKKARAEADKIPLE